MFLSFEVLNLKCSVLIVKRIFYFYYGRYVKTALDFIKWKKNYDIEKEVQLDDKNSK